MFNAPSDWLGIPIEQTPANPTASIIRENTGGEGAESVGEASSPLSLRQILLGPAIHYPLGEPEVGE